MAPQTSSLFGGDHEQALPSVLPHHLFIMAAASVSKENDLFPLTGMANSKVKKEQHPEITPVTQKTPVVDIPDGVPTKIIEEEEEEEWKEDRLIKEIDCSVKRQEDGKGLSLKLLLKLEDRMNRQLCRTISEDQSGIDLATELVNYGLISELDLEKVASTIQENIKAPA